MLAGHLQRVGKHALRVALHAAQVEVEAPGDMAHAGVVQLFGENGVAGAGDCGEARQQALLSPVRSEEHTSELQSLMRISYAVFCLQKKNNIKTSQAVHR